MADDVAITAGVGTAIAADDISSVFYQRMKLIHGANGTNDGDVQRYNGLPVSFALPKTKRTTAAIVAATASGDTAIVSATSSQTTRVFSLTLINNGDDVVSIKLKSASTDISGVRKLYPGGSWFLPFCGEPYYVTGSNEALNLNLSANGTVGGEIEYEKSA